MNFKDKYIIQCCRAGAIGDVLMTTAAIRELRRQFPQSHIRYVTKTPDLLINNPHIDELSLVRNKCDREILFEYPMHNGYPDQPLTRHIANEFASCAEVELDSVEGDIYFHEHELSLIRNVVKKFTVPVATIHIKSGWSPYKDWPIENWQKVIDHFFGRLAFIQIGGFGEPVLRDVVALAGELSIRLSATCIAVSDIFLGVDSFANHVAGALGKPAVVVFGSTSPVGSGYDTAINLWSAEDCSPCYREYNSMAVHKKEPCPYEIKCQRRISVDRLIEAVESIVVKQQLNQKEE